MSRPKTTNDGSTRPVACHWIAPRTAFDPAKPSTTRASNSTPSAVGKKRLSRPTPISSTARPSEMRLSTPNRSPGSTWE